MRPLTALLLVLSAAPALADSDEATLRHIKLVLWPQAYREQDPELLGRVLHESFEKLDVNGERSTRQQELDHVASHAWTAEGFRYDIERLEIYAGQFAIIDGRGTTADYTYVSSNYLVKEDGRWQAVASHVSGYRRLGQAEPSD